MSAPGTAGDPSSWPAHIRARYGVRERGRWVPWLIGGLGLVFVVAVTLVGWRVANPAIDAGIVAYVTVAEDHMDLRFDVARREAGPATCVLRARAEDGFDVGYATVDLPPAQGRTTHDFAMRTAYRGFVGELLGCGLDGPPPGIPGAQFRPGVVPPEQPWTPAGG
jgi:hypothetical protein